MSDTVISVEDVSKAYRLGQLGGGTLREDFTRWWAKLLRKPDPYLKIGEEHHARKIGEQFWALDGVSFQVKRGEVLGVIGRNGAGKSTLLKVLSHVTTPTAGQVKIKGRIASLLEVGTGFHPELTGRENIFLNGAILGMTKAEIRRKFDEIVAFSGIEEFIDTPVKRYSSGMYVRLAFAVAAHLEPEILIVDEVLAVGDAEFQKKCLGKMEDVSKGGRTVLFVSHNMDAVLRLCNRAIFLMDGKVRLNGDTRTAVSAYSALRQEQPEIVSLRSYTRSSFARLKARYTDVKMILAKGAKGWNVPYGDQLAFEVSLESSCVLSGLELGISIFNSAGSEITSNLSSHAFSLKSTEAGQHVFRAIFPNLRLLPGSYYVQLGLRSEAGFEDFVPRACDFDILTSELSSKHMADTFRGILVPEVNYEFK
jgi:lipopolysaccharide transport system ATP-binding protein